MVPVAPTASRTADDAFLDLIFRQARTHRAWIDRPVALELLREIYDTMKFGPTSANVSPLRILFLTTESSKGRLLPAMDAGNVEKTRTAPVVAVFAYDLRFFDRMGKLMPGREIASWFADPAVAERSAFQNSTLQAAYFIIAARAQGLDCGPMLGFDAAKVNTEFFTNTSWRVNFICNLGYGDPSQLGPRMPRLDFEEAALVL